MRQFVFCIIYTVLDGLQPRVELTNDPISPTEEIVLSESLVELATAYDASVQPFVCECNCSDGNDDRHDHCSEYKQRHVATFDTDYPALDCRDALVWCHTRLLIVFWADVSVIRQGLP